MTCHYDCTSRLTESRGAVQPGAPSQAVRVGQTKPQGTVQNVRSAGHLSVMSSSVYGDHVGYYGENIAIQAAMTTKLGRSFLRYLQGDIRKVE